MQQIRNEESARDGGTNHKDKGDHLSERDVVGGALLFVVVAGLASGYYAYNYITKDSGRMQFWVSFMFSFAALVVIAIQVVIYWQQARFMRQQVNVIRIAERGYIGIEKASLVKGLTVGEKPTIRITFRNSGRTPVWNMMHPLRITFGTTFPDGRPIQFRDEGTTFLAAGLTADIECTVGTAMTPEFVSDVTSGDVKIFVNGENHFRDCWNEKRIEPFKLVYIPRLGRFATYGGARNDLREQDGAWSFPVESQHTNTGEPN